MDIPIFDFLKKQLGLKTDAADPAGSLHAKVAEIRNIQIQAILNRFNNLSLQKVLVEMTTGWDTTIRSASGPSTTGKGLILTAWCVSGSTLSTLRAAIEFNLNGEVIPYYGMPDFGGNDTAKYWMKKNFAFGISDIGDTSVPFLLWPFYNGFTTTCYWSTSSGASTSKPTFGVYYFKLEG